MEPVASGRSTPNTASETTPQWSPPTSGGSTDLALTVLALAEDPQWSPPTSGGSTQRGPGPRVRRQPPQWSELGLVERSRRESVQVSRGDRDARAERGDSAELLLAPFGGRGAGPPEEHASQHLAGPATRSQG